jgi:hypothetical protein
MGSDLWKGFLFPTTTWNSPPQSSEIKCPSRALVAEIGGLLRSKPPSYLEEYDKYKNSDLLQLAFEVAEGKNFRDLLMISWWARRSIGTKAISHVLFSVAAAVESRGSLVGPAGEKYVEDYCVNIIQSVDDILGVFEAYCCLFKLAAPERGFTLPQNLKRGLAKSFLRFSEKDFLRHGLRGRRPQFRDVLRMIDRRKNYPLSEGLYSVLVGRGVTSSHDTPVSAARKELFSKKVFDDRAVHLIKKSGVNWESVVSHFGSSKAVWESVLPLMSTVDILKNLHNFEKEDVFCYSWELIFSALDSEDVFSAEFLFHFFKAREVVTTFYGLKAVELIWDRIEDHCVF